MKAILLTEYGGVEKLELREISNPKPGPGQVRVKAAATSVNPIDWKLRSGAFQAWMPLTLPAVAGQRRIRRSSTRSPIPWADRPSRIC